MKSLPEDVRAYRSTGEFSESTIPSGLLRAHTTKRDVWGRIRVLSGSLRYRILEPSEQEFLLSPDLDGIVEPEVRHLVEPCGPTRFFVEFLRRDDSGS
jgi:tellurite resistance-related uncharacterized protein